VNHRKSTPIFVPSIEFFNLSDHAEMRMAQRNVSWHDVQFVLQYGQRYLKTGNIHVFLGTRDIPGDLRREYARLEGTTVLVNQETDTIITVYRDRHSGANYIRRKEKEARRARRRQPLYPVFSDYIQ
jgi:hypothetical protein